MGLSPTQPQTKPAPSSRLQTGFVDLPGLLDNLRDQLYRLLAIDTLRSTLDREISAVAFDYLEGLVMAKPAARDFASDKRISLTDSANQELNQLYGWYGAFSQDAEIALRRALRYALHHLDSDDISEQQESVKLHVMTDYPYSQFPIGVYFLLNQGEIVILSVRHLTPRLSELMSPQLNRTTR